MQSLHYFGVLLIILLAMVIMIRLYRKPASRFLKLLRLKTMIRLTIWNTNLLITQNRIKSWF